MVAIAEVKGVMPQADPHNYDEETKEFDAAKTEPVMVQQEQTV
jgi:molybdopterin-containing oxidoreductase family membrane subunit